MSQKALRYCAAGGCSTLVEKGRCAAHDRDAWRGESPPPPRIRGRKLQQLRAELHAHQPWCNLCGRVITLAEMIRDHITNLEEGGRDIPENTQPLCKVCSDAKTAKESQRGKERRAGGYAKSL